MVAHSLRETLSAQPTQSLRAQLDDHGVNRVRALMASVVARDCHRRHFGGFGSLGGAVGPIEAIGDQFRLNTDLGHIEVRDFKPFPAVTHSVTVQFAGLEILETNETYDEPYIVMSVVTLAPAFDDEPDKMVASKLIQVPGEDHPRSHVFSDVQTVWKEGQLIGGTGIKVAIFAYEEDSGDPEEVAAEINAYVQAKARQASEAIAGAFNAGAGATSVLDSPEVQAVITLFSLGLAGWAGDDEVGYASIEISMDEIKQLAALHRANQLPTSLKTGPNGIKYYKDGVAGGDGKYRVYIRVLVKEIPAVPLGY